jgi:LmbE family N-acetylglucosaminyl deacetylase
VITAVSVDRLGTVLGVWAHPDDEAFLSAGLMALARAAGNRVVCLSATAGGLGTDRPDLWPPEELAALRVREHRAALAALGVDEMVQLGYDDGSCADVPADEAVTKLLAVIEEVRPDTVLTFGPDGMTGHSDHRAVGAWATAAVVAAQRPIRLLYATTTPAHAERQRPVGDALGAFPPGYPFTTEPTDLAVHLVLDESLLERKVASLRAHASQTRGQEEVVGSVAWERWWPEEAFVAADIAWANEDRRLSA